MNSFAELVKNRRSVRQFTEEPLQPHEVEQIMKSALMAPTSKSSRPWHFILVEEKNTLEQLSQAKSSGISFVKDAPLAILVLSDPVLSSAHVEDATIAATYIQLQAQDLGLNSCWIQIAGREMADGYDSEQYIRELLDIPLQLTVECIIAIGHKAKESKPQNEDKLLWDRLHIEKFRHDSPID